MFLSGLSSNLQSRWQKSIVFRVIGQVSLISNRLSPGGPHSAPMSPCCVTLTGYMSHHGSLRLQGHQERLHPACQERATWGTCASGLCHIVLAIEANHRDSWQLKGFLGMIHWGVI